MKKSFNTTSQSFGKKNDIATGRTVFGDVNIANDNSNRTAGLAILAGGLALLHWFTRKDPVVIQPEEKAQGNLEPNTPDAYLAIVHTQAPEPAPAITITPYQPLDSDRRLVYWGKHILIGLAALLLLWLLSLWAYRSITSAHSPEVEATADSTAQALNKDTTTYLSVYTQAARIHCGQCDIKNVRITRDVPISVSKLATTFNQGGIKDQNGNIIGRKVWTSDSLYSLTIQYHPHGYGDINLYNAKTGQQEIVGEFDYTGVPLNSPNRVTKLSDYFVH